MHNPEDCELVHVIWNTVQKKETTYCVKITEHIKKTLRSPDR